MSNSLYASAEYSTALAVVGMAGRFSGSQSLEGFWQNIARKVSTIRHYTDAELLAAGVKPEDLQQPNYVKAGSVLENIEYFDTSFFGFSPREAEVLDPQFRIFLECVWEVLEMAGYDLTTFDGLIGVFAGAGYKNYLLHHIQKTPAISNTMSEFQVSLAQEADVLAALTSYKLNLKGPSVSVQSFCSTSLLGVHLACQSLLNYECDIAVAGGVALNSLQMKGYFYEEGRIVSPDGLCRPFDARAQGTVLGNGAAVVALKRLQEALADGDQIYSIIRGSATNNDGNQRVSFTSPGLNGQASVIASAMSYAGVHPETIAYIEANGTGTKLGDAIELAAMIKAFSGKTQKEHFCAIGSLKPNIGHLDRASGVAGLIKATLALRHHQLPPHLHYEQPNPEVDLANSPFYVNTDLIPWPRQQTPRRAGINSFGLGGTNVHLVIEEAPELESTNSLRTWHIFPISARTEWSLQQAMSNLSAHVSSHTDQACADIAYTLQVGRSDFSYRNFVIAQTPEEARVALEHQTGQFTHQEHRDRPVALLLPDTDARYRDLVRRVYAQEPHFREIVVRCFQSLPTELRGELQDLLLSEQETLPAAEWGSTEQRELTQSAIFVIQYALAQLLLEWGIQPQALLGHGPGEYAAACLAGILTLEDALVLVAYHAQLASQPETVSRVSLNALRTFTLQAPRIPLVSPVTGTWITPAQATDLNYWLQRTGHHTSFDQGVALLLQDSELVLLELGTERKPGNLVKLHDSAEQQSQICSLSGPDNDQAAIVSVLGRLWLAGVTIDWKRLSRGERRLRVPLPTYPFERQRCWIDDPANLNVIRQRVAKTKKEADIADWFYLPYWQPTFPPALPESTTRQQAENAYMLFIDPSGIGAQVAASLGQAGYLVITVEAGQSFAQRGNNHFSLRPGVDEDYAALFTALGRLELRPRTILHCWNVTVDGDNAAQFASTDEQSGTGFTSLLSLARAIGASIYDMDMQLLVVSNHIQTVTGQERIQPEKAPILAACKVITQEYPAIACRSIDLTDTHANGWIRTRLAKYLAGECLAVSAEPVVAYRGSRRWVQQYEPLPLPTVARNASPLRNRGVYLIIGRLGEIGLIVAEYLAKVQATIVLIDEAPFPVHDQWSTWLDTHPQNDPVSQTIQRLQALEAIKARVVVLQGAFDTGEQLKQVIERIHHQYGVLHGVLHLTGGADLQTIQDLNLEDYAVSFRAKQRSLSAMQQALADSSLDFCLLFSSLTGILGGLGSVVDAAMSTFTDAFALKQNQNSATPWISVDWEPWSTSENEQRFASTTISRFVVSPDEGRDALSRILASQQTHIVVSTGNLLHRLQQWVQVKSEHTSSHQEFVALSSARPPVSTAYVAPESPVEQKIVEIWQILLGFEQIGIHDNFFELHGHSLLGMQLIARLRQLFQVNIPLTKVFEGPTVAELALVIEALIIEEIEKLDEAEAQVLI